MQNGFMLPSRTQDVYFHHVQPGDTLSGIINAYYPDKKNKAQSQLQQVLIDNPGIKNPDLIKPGQLIVLRTAVANMCLTPIDLKETNQVKYLWRTMDPKTKEAIKETSPIFNGLSLGLAGGGTALFTLNNALSSNMSLLRGIPDAYHEYKAGKISKYEFDKIRKLKLNQYTSNIGPAINKIIYGDQKVKDSFKLKPGRSLNATKSMTQHMSKLTSISKSASNGGVVLAGVGLAASCYQITKADTLPEKNEIAVKAISSTVTGAFVGGIATILLVGTPVGWGVIIAVGVGTAITSWGAGELAGSVYKSQFTDTDVVNSLGISRVCN